jgi:hypothetical protein
MTKAKAKAEQKAIPADIPEKVPVRLALKPNPFTADKAADDYSQFIAANVKHSVLRMAALEAGLGNDLEGARAAHQKANEAFGELAPFVFVQCPYCHVPLHTIDNVHLANCPEVQKKYSGKMELWTLEQCLKDFPGIQTKSWLASYIAHVTAVIPVQPVRPVSPLPPRPAVIDKRKALNAIRPRVRVVGQPIHVQPQIPAVVQRKGYVPPRFQKR